MGVSNYKGRALRALQFKENNTIWGVIGKSSPYPDGDKLVAPLPSQEEIPEPICFVKPQFITLCRSVSVGGNIEIAGQRYEFVDDDSAIEDNAYFLYALFKFDPTVGQPYGEFRQCGMVVNLVPADGYDDSDWLSPENVVDTGILCFTENDDKTTMSLARSELIEMLFEVE